MAGRPRTKASHDIRLPPAGCTSCRTSTPSAVRQAVDAVERARLLAGRRPDPGRPDDESDRRRCRRTNPARAGRHGPGARARRPGDRVEPSVLAPERPGQRRSIRRTGAAPRASPRATVRGSVEEPRGQRGQAILEPRCDVSVSVEARSARPRRAARVEAFVHPHERDARLPVAGEDRGRDRSGAAMARQQGRVQVQRAMRQSEERRRDDLPVVGQDERAPGRSCAGSRRSTAGSRSRSGVRTGPTPSFARRHGRSGSR